MVTRRFLAVIVSVLICGAGAARGQDYPNKPIRIIAGGAGGGGDFAARQIAQGISAPLGQPVIVENRAGGATVYGEFVAKSPPDGYVLSINGASTWIIPLFRKTPYDAVRDFGPIVLTSRTVFVIGVHPSVPAKSIKELIALAKARPGDLNYGSPGVSSSQYLAAELFKSMAGVNIVHVPYKGDATGITALISGEVQMYVTDAGLLAPHVKSGKVRALAVSSAEPSIMAPGLPTVAASGLPGYEATVATGMFAPAKTPTAIVNRLNQEIVRVLNRPEVKERFMGVGEEVVASTPEQFAAAIKADIARMSKVITDAGIKIE